MASSGSAGGAPPAEPPSGSAGGAPPAEPAFVVLGYGNAKRHWQRRGHAEDELEALWRSAEKVEVPCRFIKYRDPDRILRVRWEEGGQYFEVRAKIPLPEEPEEGDVGQ